MMRRRRAAHSRSQSPQPASSLLKSHPSSSSSDRTASSPEDSRPRQQNEQQHPTKTTTTTRLGDVMTRQRQRQRVLYPIIQRCTYYTCKWAILRLLAAVYLTAFIGAWYQNEGLMGSHGIVPAEQYWKEHVMPRYHQDDNDNNDFRWRWKRFLDYPSLLIWWIPLSDFTMRYFIIAPGIVISFMVLFLGVNSWLLQLLLWILDFSIVTVASNATSSFYAYGWESQLLETGFLAIFLCNLPVYDWRCKKCRLNLWENKSSNNGDDDDNDDDESPPPSEIILWLFCWLMFRISLGAGLIKIRGSSCWALKTCLHYHFETQPIPSPLSFLFHFLPKSIQTHMVDIDLWVQLYTSWIVLLPTNNNIIGSSFPWPHGRNPPSTLVHDDSTATAAAATASNTMLITEWILLCCRWLVRLGGWIQAGFMVGIILSGNFGFLNHLTIVPALACLDDECWPLFMNRRRRCRRPRSARTTTLSSGSMANTAAAKNDNDTSSSSSHVGSPPCRQRWIVLDWILFGCIMYLSWPVIANLLQLEGRGRQVMNMSFGSFRLVNTYGAFGDVSRTRYEPIVSIHGGNETDQWIELEFPCKPGSLTRRPCFSAPYHYRLDWNIWFLGFKPHKRYLQQREQWMYSFLKKVLEPPTKNDADDQPWLNLLDRSTAEYLKSTYYSKGTAPRYAKVDMYYYGMAGPLWEILAEIFRTGQAHWWKRAFEEHLILPVEVSHNRLQFALVDGESK